MRDRASSGGANQGAGTLDPGGTAWGGNQALRQQLDGIGASADELGRQLRELGVPAGDINPVLDKINELTQAQNDQDMSASAERHKRALNALMELEYKLRKHLSAPEFPELLISESTEIPDDYKEMVADYFRMLSQP